MKIKRTILSIILLTGLVGVPVGWSDCGSVPFVPAPDYIDRGFVEANISPVDAIAHGYKTVQEYSQAMAQLDPMDVTIFEPGQRAIILWNGQEEILLLSTDQRASHLSAVLEVIPLPAKPTVRLGKYETFEKARKLGIEKRMWAVAHGGVRPDLLHIPKDAGKIEFHQRLGAHDISVARVLDGKGFISFVQDYLQKTYKVLEAPIKPQFVDIIEGYMNQGFKYFAFDVIWLNDKKNGSREPIEYRFASDAVFYPMTISTMETGETQIDLTVITAEGLGKFEQLERDRFQIQRPVSISDEELAGLEESWRGFFLAGRNLTLDDLTLQGDIKAFTKDVVIR